MGKYLFLTFSVLFWTGVLAGPNDETTLYEDILALEFMHKDFDSKKTDTGVDFDSKDKVKVTEEIIVSKIHINLEGPFPIREDTTLNQVMNQNINSIFSTTELNKEYIPKDKVAEGMGAVKVNVNGLEVGYLDYQVPSMNMAKVRRALIIKNNKLYGFTISLFDPNVNPKRAMVFDMLIIAAINSGKL